MEEGETCLRSKSAGSGKTRFLMPRDVRISDELGRTFNFSRKAIDAQITLVRVKNVRVAPYKSALANMLLTKKEKTMIIGDNILCRRKGPVGALTFLQASRIGLIAGSRPYRYNNGSAKVAATEAAVKAGVCPLEKLSRVREEQRWMRRIQRCFAKRGFSRTTRELIASYDKWAASTTLG